MQLVRLRRATRYRQRLRKATLASCCVRVLGVAHHSCALGPDARLYDAVGVELE